MCSNIILTITYYPHHYLHRGFRTKFLCEFLICQCPTSLYVVAFTIIQYVIFSILLLFPVPYAHVLLSTLCSGTLLIFVPYLLLTNIKQQARLFDCIFQFSFIGREQKQKRHISGKKFGAETV